MLDNGDEENICCTTSIGMLPDSDNICCQMVTIFVVQQALVCCQIAKGLVREGRIREPYLHCFGNEDAFVDFDD